MNELLIAVQLV